MKIILAGGGTLGSVSPLIAIWQRLKAIDNNLTTIFLGTKNGPEKELIAQYHIPYYHLAGAKLRRYFSFNNLIVFFELIGAIAQAFSILKKFKPDFIVSAGGFVSVPLVWVSRFFKTKVVLYQSDLKIGLSNKFCQGQADYIFTAFPETVKQFSKKAELAGTVLRQEIHQINSSLKFGNNLLILGGGTGSQIINDLVINSLSNLTSKYKIVHVCGLGKQSIISRFGYQSFEILTNDYYQKIAEADLVISRAGLSTLMELSFLAKPVILIPYPSSPQEKNASCFCQKNAAVCLNQQGLSAQSLIAKIDQLMNDRDTLINLSKNINKIFNHQGEKRIAQKIYDSR